MANPAHLKAAAYGSFILAFGHAVTLLNLQWSLNPQALDEPLNRAIAGLLTLIAWGSSVSYLRGGVKSSGLITAAAGAFQAWAAFRG
ncbi:hypothetical protein APSETT444_007172 [Aspergillus pseudonomiae]